MKTIIRTDVPGHPGYAASKDGRLWTCWKKGPHSCPVPGRWKLLEGHPPNDKKGRRTYALRRPDGSFRKAYGAVFILETFIGPCPPGLEGCHNNGDYTDDSVDNLRWDTRANNAADMVRHGHSNRGEKHSKAKLSDKDFLFVYRAKKTKTRKTALELSLRFRVNKTLIYQIWSGHLRKYLLPKETL